MLLTVVKTKKMLASEGSDFEALQRILETDQSGDKELAYILNAADTLAKVKHDDIPVYEISSVINENVSDYLGLEPEDVAAIFIEMKELEKNFA